MGIAKTPSIRFQIIHNMLRSDNNVFNISYLCELAGVSRSGFYNWVAQTKNREKRESSDQKDFALILEAHKYRGYDKGVRGIHMRLIRSMNVTMNPKKIRRLMRKYGLTCKIRKANPYRRMAKALKESKVAPNLLNREFRKHGKRAVILTDITYIRNATGKFTYLCVMLDAFTKEILEREFSANLEVDFVELCAKNLVKSHDLSPDALVHSDQGVHFKSEKFVRVLTDAKLRQSMSRRANCWDNAPQESLFGHMKQEVTIRPEDTHEDIVRKIDDWIDYYNNDRHQWGLGKMTPSEYYKFLTTGKIPPGALPPDPQGLTL